MIIVDPYQSAAEKERASWPWKDREDRWCMSGHMQEPRISSVLHHCLMALLEIAKTNKFWDDHTYYFSELPARKKVTKERCFVL